MFGILKFFILLVGSTALLLGCTVGPDFARPKPPQTDRYNHEADPTQTVKADAISQNFEADTKMVSEWWKLFNSPKLDTAVKNAIANNLQLDAAQASLRQSKENLQAGYGIFYPQINADFGGKRQKFSPQLFGSNAPSSIFNLVTLSASASYALDIFGGERRVIEGLQSKLDLQRSLVQGTYIVLTGNIVNTFIAEAAYREQIGITEKIIALQKEQIKITEKQVEAGTTPYANVLALISQLNVSEATLPPLKQKLSQTEHLLATLSGRSPAEWISLDASFDELTLPGHLPLSLPTDLIKQRPDILAAEAQLHSASADIGVATAALFPSFTLNAGYGQNSMSMNTLFKSNSNFWSTGANLDVPLFNGGTLLSQRQSAIEGYNASLANYRQTVLSAFAQVADTLTALEHDAESLDAQSRGLSTAEDALQLTQANYQAGMVNDLQVIIANEQYLQAKIGYIESKTQRFQDTVVFFVALGGGWWNAAQ